MITSHRNRRIVRMVARAAGATLLVANGYVGGWLVFSHVAHHRYISPAVTNAAAPLFEPLVGYCTAGHPGGGILSTMWWTVNPPIHRNVPLIGVAAFPAPFAPPRPADGNSHPEIPMLDPVEPGGCR